MSDRNILKGVDLRNIPIINAQKGIPDHVAKDLGLDPSEYTYVGRLDVHVIQPKKLSVGLAFVDPMHIPNLTPESLTNTLVSSIVAHLELICTISDADIRDVMELVQNVADVAIQSKAAREADQIDTSEDEENECSDEDCDGQPDVPSVG